MRSNLFQIQLKSRFSGRSLEFVFCFPAFFGLFIFIVLYFRSLKWIALSALLQSLPHDEPFSIFYFLFGILHMAMDRDNKDRLAMAQSDEAPTVTCTQNEALRSGPVQANRFQSSVNSRRILLRRLRCLSSDKEQVRIQIAFMICFRNGMRDESKTSINPSFFLICPHFF